MDDRETEHDDAAGTQAIDRASDPRSELRERTRRQLTAVAVSAVVMLVAGVAALVLLGDDDGSSGDVGTTPVPDPDDQGPGVPDGGADPLPPGLDTSHPLVGRPESEARQVYPVVRSEWVDGGALALTMDLVPGRVGIAVEDGVILAAGAEGCEELSEDAWRWQQQACAPSPDDGPTVWGRLVERDGGLALDPDPGEDRYYEFLQVVPFSEHPDLVGAGGVVAVDLQGDLVEESDLAAGDRVALWITLGCEERYPVACTVDAIVADR